MHVRGPWTVLGLLVLTLRPRPCQAVLLQEEASYSNPLGAGSHSEGSQNEQERRMRLLYVERKPLLNQSVLCNDGSPAGYYIRKSQLSPNWIIFLEGGSYCYDQVSCSDRKSSDPRLCSSHTWPPNRPAAGIVSGDGGANPLYANETVVLVPYCSSDLWSGNSLRRSNVSDFYFMGSLIVKEVVKQLLATENLAMAHRVLLAGSSAGGIGALLNVHKVKSLVEQHARRQRIHPAPQVRALVDSAWFVDISPQDLSKMDRLLPSQNGPEPRSRWGRPRTTAAPRPTVAGRKGGQCTGLLGCPFALQEAVKVAVSVWQSDLPHDCTARLSGKEKAWRCFYPFVLLRSLRKSASRVAVFVVQNVYDRAQVLMDSGFGRQQLGPAYLEALRDKMRTTLLKTSPMYVGMFAPACFGHEMLSRYDWSQWKVNESSVIDALRCWEQKLDDRHSRALSILAERNKAMRDGARRPLLRPDGAKARCNSRLFQLDSYPLDNAYCPTVMTQRRGPVDRVGILREFGYSDMQINRVLYLTGKARLTTSAWRPRKFKFPTRIPLP